MKRAAILCLALLLLLSGCMKDSGEERIKDNIEEYHKGAWITYNELNSMLSADFKAEFSLAMDRLEEMGITDIFVHTRAFCDSYYPSEFFPLSKSVNTDFDILEFMVSSAHSKGIRFHAWINPYRVRTADNSIEALDKNSPAYKWVSEGETQNVLITGSGIYLNPASLSVRLLVLNGIREILKNYAVDGIHFDDYFYPENLGESDKSSFEVYASSTLTPLNIEDWRRGNINALVSSVYTAVKFINKDIIFSISPAADIDKNYEKSYADIALWAKSGCVDWIIPQLYFGFSYPDEAFRFDNLLEEWKSYLSGSKSKILIGLANYKIGTSTLPDAEEWVLGGEIIKRQEQICKADKDIYGHIYFSYSYIK